MTTEPPSPDADSHDPGDRFAPPNTTPDGEPVPPRRSRGLLIAAWGLGVAVVIAATVLVTTLILSADDEAAIETTDPLDSTTTTTTTTTEPDPDPEPEPTTPDTQPDTPAVLDEPAGLFCRDLNAKGYNYNEAVDYWEHHGRPVNMDAAGNGVPCQTVYPASQVEARWGASATRDACPTSAEIRSGLRQLPPRAGVEVDFSELEVSDLSCSHGWAVAAFCPIECLYVYFEQTAGGWVGRDFADGFGSDFVCPETVRSQQARDALCPIF